MIWTKNWKKTIRNTAAMTAFATAAVVFLFSAQDVQADNRRGDFVVNDEGTTVIDYDGTGGSITIPDGITTIGAGAFMDAPVTNVDLNEVKTVGNNAFSGSDLISVTGTAGVKAIGGEAFARTSISAFSIPKSLKKLSGSAFDENIAMTGFSGGSDEYQIYGGCVYSDGGRTLYIVPKGLNDSVTISKKATAIAPNALKGCEGVTDLYIPATITQFGGRPDINPLIFPETTTIYGYSGSDAETYAKASDVKFVSVGKVDGNAAAAERSASVKEETEEEAELQTAAVEPKKKTRQTESYEEETTAETDEAEVSVETAAVEKGRDVTASMSVEEVWEEPDEDAYIEDEDYLYDTDEEYDEEAADAAGNPAHYAAVTHAAQTIDIPSIMAQAPAIEAPEEDAASNTANAGSTTQSSTSWAEAPSATASETVRQDISTETAGSTAAATVTAELPTEGATSSATTNNTGTSAAPQHILDKTPKTADLSVGSQFIFCAALFLVGLAVIFYTRRQGVLHTARPAYEPEDELD